MFFFFFNDTATTEIYTLSLHDALPILGFLGWGSLYKHKRIALGKKWCEDSGFNTTLLVICGVPKIPDRTVIGGDEMKVQPGVVHTCT